MSINVILSILQKGMIKLINSDVKVILNKQVFTMIATIDVSTIILNNVTTIKYM